jgi:glycosyltransferase involved in cell wall biosynthesis
MACGVPVVCSNATSLIEVAQGAAHMVNPLNVEEMAMGMDQVLTDDVYRSDLVLKGRRRVVDFEESRTAGRLYDFFRSMMRS